MDCPVVYILYVKIMPLQHHLHGLGNEEAGDLGHVFIEHALQSALYPPESQVVYEILVEVAQYIVYDRMGGDIVEPHQDSSSSVPEQAVNYRVLEVSLSPGK